MAASRHSSGHRRTRWPLLAVAAGLLVAIAAPLTWARYGGTASSQFGTGSAAALATAGSAAAPVQTTAVPTPKRGALADPRATDSATRSPVVRPVAAPVRIRIDALGLDAAVIPEGVDASGEMAVPEDVRVVGWYRFGPAPGATTGSAVVVGHVDSAVQGLGVFAGLRTLQRGDLVTITAADHRTTRFWVVAREQFAKPAVPLAAIFARTGPPRLTLVTCGGAFDAAARSYRDNIVVTAEPV